MRLKGFWVTPRGTAAGRSRSEISPPGSAIAQSAASERRPDARSHCRSERPPRTRVSGRRLLGADAAPLRRGRDSAAPGPHVRRRRPHRGRGPPGAARCRHGRRRRAAPLSLSLSPRRHRGRGAPRSPTDGPPAPPRGRARSLPPSRRGALPASTGPAENGSRRRPGSEPQPPAGSRVRNGARRGDPPSGSVPPAVPTL